MAVGVRSLVQAGCTPRNCGEIGPLLVIGGGPIGLTIVAVARHWGFEVDLVARHSHRREAGEQLGASLSLRNEYAVTVEAAGTQSALDDAIARTRPGGNVAVPGTYWSPVSLSNTFQVRHVSLVPSMVYGSFEGVRDFELAASALAGTPHLAQVLISHTFGLDEAPEAFRVAADRAAGALKVQILVN
jgi:threonine dehydrogenase-like Zn-dependent dehydrogenase